MFGFSGGEVPTDLIQDVVGNSEAVARLQVIAVEGNLPNLILAVCAAPCAAR